MRSKLVVAVAVGSCLAVNLITRAGDSSLRVLPETVNGAPTDEMMTRYLQQQAQKCFERWRQQYEQRKTPEQIAAYQQYLREQFLLTIGDLPGYTPRHIADCSRLPPGQYPTMLREPPARTPLNPRVTGVVRRDGYRVEKVIFESQPKFYVTALLFLPEGGGFTPPFPGVIVPCGHADDAKAYEAYQTMGALLALNGMAALVFDPIDQGERSQWPAALPQLRGTTAHTMLGVGSILLGWNTARYEIWDGMRAIDYLQSRPEIDLNRIGCTGNSGGGTQTSYLMALDDRIKAAAPSCYITGFEALLSTIGPQDAEQNIFGQLGIGIDHADYLMMRAPTPILVCAATRDFFDIQGTWTCFRYAQRLYTRLGAPERISLLENDAEHNYNQVQRQGIVRWMARWLRGNDKPIVEPAIKLLDETETRCTPDGHVMHLEGARSTYDLNREQEKELAGRRKVRWSSTSPRDALAQVRQIGLFRTLAELPEAKIEEHGTIEHDGLTVQKIVLKPEEGVYLPALLFGPKHSPSGTAVLYLHESGKATDAGPGGPIQKLVRAGRMVLAVDLRGTGETQARNGWGGEFFGSDTKDVLTAYLLLRSYVGMRMEDVLTCARFLQGRSKRPVDVVAVGHVCAPALHAAALESQLFGSVKLVRGLISWSNVVKRGQSRNQLVNAVHGALTAYDLPDLARTLGDRLTVEEPLNALGEPVRAEDDREGVVLKKALRLDQGGENLLKPDAWTGWQKGFAKVDGAFLCDNGTDSQAQRGVSQTVTLNQTKPEPIVATAWSKTEGVGGSRDRDYSLYLDLVYTDGTPLWGQVDSFNVGTHDWEKAQVIVFPEKPVTRVSFHMLLRNHAGKAWFRDAELKTVSAFLFDGVPVQQVSPAPEGFQVRDVAADSDFVAIHENAQELLLDCRTQETARATFYDVTLQDTSGRDRAVTLVYAVPLPAADWRWLADPRHSSAAAEGREYLNAARYRVGANGRLSRYPFGAVASSDAGVALGIDMAQPAFFRVGYNAGTQELFLACDLGLTPERPAATLRFCKFTFNPRWEFRAALQRYYEIFPEAFHRRIAEQGLWMPFAKISAVPNWQDFGFRFKEGTDETKWDDEHGVLTFRYTEPMTWWMRMDKGLPRTIEAALAEAQRLATEKNDKQAAALFTSGYHDENGQYSAQFLDTPWCDGAVWSMNSMPEIAGDITDFRNKWNPELREKLYGTRRAADQDGEYIDSSEGYVTEELDFRRDHFSAARTPLTFSLDSRKPAIFRGLIVFEYIRAIGQDVHGLDKYMMANATPYGLCWLAPLLDVLGTETDWNPGGKWQPMSDSDLLYRRALCRGKPYCFLMNTEFERFSHELVEKYMKRSLAYGMFPGFFSANASTGHYFARPELYERDRDLFKKYMPLCKQVAEAGWEPITLAHTDRQDVRVERFGDRYLTVFNDSGRQQRVTITTEIDVQGPARELLTGRDIVWHDKKAALTLAAEDVAVLELGL